MIESPRTMSLQAPRERLARIGRREAALESSGNDRKAGPAIEKYLAVFREALNANTETNRYSDLQTGYDLCCAFVYYCCRQAGFSLPPKPQPNTRYTLAAIPAWQEWALAEGCYHPAGSVTPEPGDLVLFDRLVSEAPLDHIGIVLEVTQPYLFCAEGNVENRTGLFQRSYDKVAGYIRLPQVTFRFGRFMLLMLAVSPITGAFNGIIARVAGPNSWWHTISVGLAVNLYAFVLFAVQRPYRKGRLPWLEDHS